MAFAFIAVVSYLHPTPAGIALGIAASLYLLPTVVASGRAHETIAGIFALNLLLGRTFVGWVAALCWALSKPRLARANSGL